MIYRFLANGTNTAFLINVSGFNVDLDDIAVYVSTADSLGLDDDFLVNESEYVINSTNTELTVTFNNAPINGSYITIIAKFSNEPSFNFSTTVLKPEELNGAFTQHSQLFEDTESDFGNRPYYKYSGGIPTQADKELPVLGEEQTWVKRDGKITNVNFPSQIEEFRDETKQFRDEAEYFRNEAADIVVHGGPPLEEKKFPAITPERDTFDLSNWANIDRSKISVYISGLRQADDTFEIIDTNLVLDTSTDQEVLIVRNEILGNGIAAANLSNVNNINENFLLTFANLTWPVGTKALTPYYNGIAGISWERLSLTYPGTLLSLPGSDNGNNFPVNEGASTGKNTTDDHSMTTAQNGPDWVASPFDDSMISYTQGTINSIPWDLGSSPGGNSFICKLSTHGEGEAFNIPIDPARYGIEIWVRIS